MADNPLQQDPDREHRIRERAYHLWEQDGRPHGRDREYWERARSLIATEDNPDAGQRPDPTAHPDQASASGVEEVAIQQNFGEVPGRAADPGEVRRSPAEAGSARKPPRSGTKPATAPRRRKT